MLIRVTAVEVCDARDDDSSNAAGQQKKYKIIATKKQKDVVKLNDPNQKLKTNNQKPSND